MGSFQIKDQVPSLIKFSYPTDEKFATQSHLIESYKGNTVVIDLIWYQNGEPKDLTGYEIRFSIKLKQFDPEPLLYLSSKTEGFDNISRINITNITKGYFSIIIVPKDSNLFSVGDHVFWIDVVDSINNITTIYKDYLELR